MISKIARALKARRIAKMKLQAAREAIRLDYEVAKQKTKVLRAAEDAKKRLQREEEDWRMELAFHSDMVDQLERELKEEVQEVLA